MTRDRPVPPPRRVSPGGSGGRAGVGPDRLGAMAYGDAERWRQSTVDYGRTAASSSEPAAALVGGPGGCCEHPTPALDGHRRSAVPEMIPLSRSAERALAAEMIRTATEIPLVTAPAALLVTEVLDAVCWSVLDHAGLNRDAARSVLATMWANR